jgi:hypothetical protein
MPSYILEIGKSMNVLAASRLVPDPDEALPADIMAMAASMAQEISEKWPFTVARLGLELFGADRRPDRRSAAGRALSLGLSGIVDGAGCARKRAGVFALQQRMMAVRLAGRKLVAFDPDRDLKFSPERSGFAPGRIRVSVWSTGRTLLGTTERLARHCEPLVLCTSARQYDGKTIEHFTLPVLRARSTG